MDDITTWAARWGVPATALLELRATLLPEPIYQTVPPQSESWALNEIRLEAAHAGVRLFRNNVGVAVDAAGRPVRYGLANESAAMNKQVKSSDLIGIRPVLVTPAHVGRTLGQFVAREIKRPGWTYRGDAREAAQMRFLEFIVAMGGDACFATGRGTIDRTDPIG